MGSGHICLILLLLFALVLSGCTSEAYIKPRPETNTTYVMYSINQKLDTIQEDISTIKADVRELKEERN